MNKFTFLDEIDFTQATRIKYYGQESGLAFSRVNDLNIIETIFFPSCRNGKSYLDLSIVMDVTPVLKKLTDQNIFKRTELPEKNIKHFENDCHYPDLRIIQQVTLLQDGFCANGTIGETEIFYPSDEVPKCAKNDIYEKCLPWFANRSDREQLISLIINDDQILLQQQKERVEMRERNKNIWHKLFLSKQKNDPIYSGVISGYGAYPVLAMLYYDAGDIDRAQYDVDHYWLEMYRLQD